jgi:hypothetical protein
MCWFADPREKFEPGGVNPWNPLVRPLTNTQ